MNNAASADLLRLLAALAERPTPAHVDYAAALDLAAPADLDGWRVAHTAAFIEQCPPYASTVVGEGGQIGGVAAERVGDFRGLLGGAVEAEADGLAGLLADYAELVAEAETDARAGHARAALLWEHMLCWVMPYLDGLVRSAPTPYDAWAVLVRDVLYLEAERIRPPAQLPLHLRMAEQPEPLAEADSIDAAVRMLLEPVSRGILLTRSDLARAVAAVEAGLIQNSRAFALAHLLEQEGPATLAWLAGEARSQARARRAETARLGATGVFWAERAAATAAALEALADEAAGLQTAGDRSHILCSA